MNPTSKRFTRWVFGVAGVYGILSVLPMYFLEARVGRDYPPAVSHPEYYYGFAGITLAWQFVFLVIARDPTRYRLFILPSILEKLTFGIAAWALYTRQRCPGAMAAWGSVDLVWAVLFLVAFLTTRPDPGKA